MLDDFQLTSAGFSLGTLLTIVSYGQAMRKLMFSWRRELITKIKYTTTQAQRTITTLQANN